MITITIATSGGQHHVSFVITATAADQTWLRQTLEVVVLTTLFMAMSLNGLIADEQGREDFLSHDGWEVFVELAEENGVFIIGRKTYDAVNSFYEDFGFLDVQAQRIIVTSQEVMAPAGYLIAHSPRHALELAEKLGYQKTLLTGGSILNAAFLQDELIHKIIFNIEPIILNAGTPVVARLTKNVELTFEQTTQRPNGVLQLHYTVSKHQKGGNAV